MITSNTLLNDFSFFKHIHYVYGNKTLLTDANQHRIGVFDSGMGGISVLKHLQALLPNEHFIYLADGQHVPYGNRAHQEIEQLTHAAVAWLKAQGCQIVVIACNSASAYSLRSLRAKYDHELTIVGLVPAIKPAVLASKSKKIAVLATQATLNGDLLAEVIEQHAIKACVEVIKMADPTLVPWVEKGMPEGDRAYQALKDIIIQVLNQGADHLVLGCTHFPFFKEKIQALAPQLILIDSGNAIANRVKNLLQCHAKCYGENNIKTTATHQKPAVLPVGNLLSNQQNETKDSHEITQKKQNNLLNVIFFTTKLTADDKSKIERLLKLKDR